MYYWNVCKEKLLFTMLLKRATIDLPFYLSSNETNAESISDFLGNQLSWNLGKIWASSVFNTLVIHCKAVWISKASKNWRKKSQCESTLCNMHLQCIFIRDFNALRHSALLWHMASSIEQWSHMSRLVVITVLVRDLRRCRRLLIITLSMDNNSWKSIPISHLSTTWKEALYDLPLHMKHDTRI